MTQGVVEKAEVEIILLWLSISKQKIKLNGNNILVVESRLFIIVDHKNKFAFICLNFWICSVMKEANLILLEALAKRKVQIIEMLLNAISYVRF